MFDYSFFNDLDIRIGTIISANKFPEARNPSYKLKINFGKYGILRSSAQITKLYKPENLINKKIVAVINLGSRKIGNYESECLILGAVDKENVFLLKPKEKTLNGEVVF
ncbi:MAG: tRNA-binding protein [Flavobacteriaceae bacterium]|nr:tRNA-binding protein [Flavobacteriaceae bacterium]|tara:strand:- start:2745 stop:3071 length:327 start_codon:yes stop_codon:yes gene_type:complete